MIDGGRINSQSSIICDPAASSRIARSLNHLIFSDPHFAKRQVAFRKDRAAAADAFSVRECHAADFSIHTRRDVKMTTQILAADREQLCSGAINRQIVGDFQLAASQRQKLGGPVAVVRSDHWKM